MVQPATGPRQSLPGLLQAPPSISAEEPLLSRRKAISWWHQISSAVDTFSPEEGTGSGSASCLSVWGILETFQAGVPENFPGDTWLMNFQKQVHFPPSWTSSIRWDVGPRRNPGADLESSKSSALFLFLFLQWGRSNCEEGGAGHDVSFLEGAMISALHFAGYKYFSCPLMLAEEGGVLTHR